MIIKYNRLRHLVDQIYPQVIDAKEGAFGQWIDGLWTWHPNLNYAEQKEAFFILLDRLLREGKVKFVKPDADVYHRYNSDIKDHYHPKFSVNDPETHWDAPIEEILTYLRERWPQSVSHKDDIKLTEYFYEIPAIIWRGEDGKWYSS